jgi:hypothetical protein
VVSHRIPVLFLLLAGSAFPRAAAADALKVAAYDRGRPLLIDPVLAYSTFLGANWDDYAMGIAVDASGSAYVAGATVGDHLGQHPDNYNFPTTAGAFQTAFGGYWSEAFVTKIDPSGRTAVNWIGVKCEHCGIATVAIDGGPAITVNTQGPSLDHHTSELVYSASGLAANMSHTITITVTGTTTSGGYYIAVDAIDVPKVVVESNR